MQYLFLLRQFVRRDFESRYAGSMLGFLWSLLLPAWQLLLFTFVFATVLKISLLGERTENFGVFLFCGLIPWLAVHEGVSRAATAITDNGNLVKKIHFPAEILVLSVILGAVVHQAITTGVFLLVLLGLGELSWATLPILLIAVPLQIALTLGIGLLVATIHTFLRDVAQLLGMILMGWFYLTPIVYPLNQVPESLQTALALNPMTAIVDLYRSALLGGPLPGWQRLLPLPLAALLFLLIGGWLFRRSKRAFADEL
jgi:lipopolysaccharide transport system permease protein